MLKTIETYILTAADAWSALRVRTIALGSARSMQVITVGGEQVEWPKVWKRTAAISF